MNFGIYERKLWHCSFNRTLTYSAKVCARLKFQNLSKFFSDLRKIGICFGNRPIADFFHDQTICLKDYEVYIIGHSLALELVCYCGYLTFPFQFFCSSIKE